MGMSQICMICLLAETCHVEIKKNVNFYLILECMIDRNTIWDSKKEEILEYEVWGRAGCADSCFYRGAGKREACDLFSRIYQQGHE